VDLKCTDKILLDFSSWRYLALTIHFKSIGSLTCLIQEKTKLASLFNTKERNPALSLRAGFLSKRAHAIIEL